MSSSKCVPLSNTPIHIDHESLKVLVAKLDSCQVCPGHVEMVLSKKGKLTSKNDKDTVATVDLATPVQLNGEVYTQTVRSKSCEILTNETKCAQCVNYRDTLMKSFHLGKRE